MPPSSSVLSPNFTMVEGDGECGGGTGEGGGGGRHGGDGDLGEGGTGGDQHTQKDKN